MVWITGLGVGLPEVFLLESSVFYLETDLGEDFLGCFRFWEGFFNVECVAPFYVFSKLGFIGWI